MQSDHPTMGDYAFAAAQGAQVGERQNREEIKKIWDILIEIDNILTPLVHRVEVLSEQVKALEEGRVYLGP